jgi:hypothetical protein
MRTTGWTWALLSALSSCTVQGLEGQTLEAPSVREFVVEVPEQDHPSFYPVQLANTATATATFSMTFNGALYPSSDELCAEILTMPPEYAGEPVHRKAWRFIRDHRYHYTPLTELRWQHTPALFLNSIGFGYCDDSASLLYFLWSHMGFEARVWDLGGHVVPEVFVQGRWEMYDAGLPGVSDRYYDNLLGPQQCVYYYNRQDQVAGVEELVADGTLITEPQHPVNPILETSSPYYCYSASLAERYTSTRDNAVEPWYMVDEPRYTFLLQIPAGGCLLLPGRFANLLRVTYGDPSPPLMATALLRIPAGYSGTLDNRLVLHSIRGSSLDTVTISGQTFAVGSPELQDFIDERARGRGDAIGAVTFGRLASPVEMVFLLNPLLVEMQHRNTLRLSGAHLEGIVAEIPGPGARPEGLSGGIAGPKRVPTETGYGGGSGRPDDPYRIATVQDLILLSTLCSDYARHFLLTADVDLDPNLPGRTCFSRAVVAATPKSEGGIPFTGVFDGNGHTIAHLTIQGGGTLGLFGELAPGAEVRDLAMRDVHILGSGDCVGGLIGDNQGTVVRCSVTGEVRGHWGVGGLVGQNQAAVTQCRSTARVSGDSHVGGLLGYGWAGRVTQCYSQGAVSGRQCVGGLLGTDWGEVADCYSTGAVHSTAGPAGGLVGWSSPLATASVTASFWDTQTSGQTTSAAGGEGLATAAMQTAATFLIWGASTSAPVWTVDETRDYPRLIWEHRPGEMLGRSARLSDLLPGTGTQDDPFQVSTAEGLNWIGLFPEDWDKHFRVTRDIDLAAFDGKSGRPRLNIIGPGRTPGFGYFLGAAFTGLFDGNRHAIRHLTMPVREGGCGGLFGGLGPGAEVRDLGLEDVNVSSPGCGVGALAGYSAGRVSGCYSTGAVTSHDIAVGGLLGWNYGTVADCYSISAVCGEGYAGGLVGYNGGAVARCYSAGPVNGTTRPGGVVGYGEDVTQCLWDVEASGQPASAGGTAKDTRQMHQGRTFLDAGWDLLGEAVNGVQDLWAISEDKDYPRLVWQFWAFSPEPLDRAIDVGQVPTLSWVAPATGVEHDVYFGDDEEAVTSATLLTQGVYQGRQQPERTTFRPGVLKWGKTYYWRIDEIQPDDPRSPWKGGTWSFSTADSILLAVVDDFEDYTDDWIAGPLLFETWYEVGGALVGNWDPPEGPYAERKVVHGGRQSMPLTYDNTGESGFSEAQRTWQTPQDWAVEGAEALTLYLRGRPANGQDPLYVVIEDDLGLSVVVNHADPDAVLAGQWRKWDIPLADLQALGLDLAVVKRMSIGVGSHSSPKPGGVGKIYIDDVRLTGPMP